jgi:trimethylamine:corrinoid methyltransferase-like protein
VKRSRHAGRTRGGGLSLNVFTPDEIDDIDVVTLDVLKRTGVIVVREKAIRTDYTDYTDFYRYHSHDADPAKA